jgi:hypothetical protein
MPSRSFVPPSTGRGATEVVQEVEASDEQTRLILEDCLSTFSSVRLLVTGDCMQPALQPGDFVEIVPVRARRPRLGEIVLVRHPRGLRLHRLVPGPPRGWSLLRTKADRAAYWDPPVPREAVLGVVVRAEPARDGASLLKRLRRVTASLLRTLRRRRLRRAPSADCHPPPD